MARALDHFVLGVPDLDVSGQRFSLLGFTVGAKNTHPWGTQNRIVQFSDETFLELITVADAGAIPPHAPHRFSFGAFVQDALQRATGLSMLVLKSADAKADAAEFARTAPGFRRVHIVENSGHSVQITSASAARKRSTCPCTGAQLAGII